MNIVLPFLTFLIPVFGIISGLSASISVPVFVIATLCTTKNKIIFSVRNYKLEAAFLTWLAVSCLWSPELHSSVAAFFKILAMISLGALSCTNIQNLNFLVPKIERSLILGTIAALLLFFVELLSDGIISNGFRFLFQSKNNQEFLLHFLDRGCAILALTSWLIIGIFLKYKKHIPATIYYFFIILTLAFSDNMAGFISFVLAGIVFLLTRSCPFLRNPKIVCSIFILISFSVILFFLSMNPKTLADKAEFLPLSAKHRLFIWSFVADKAIEHPYAGSGFFSSKFVSNQERRVIPFSELNQAGEFKGEAAQRSDLREHSRDLQNSPASFNSGSGIIEYGGESLSLFPLHPHNNILQIFFETGLIGLILFIVALCKYLFYIGKGYRTDNTSALDVISVSYACFATYMGIAMISYSVWQSWWICITLWITIMFCWLLPNKEVF